MKKILCVSALVHAPAWWLGDPWASGDVVTWPYVTARPSVARMHAMYTHMYMFLSFRTVSLIVMSSYSVAELRLSPSTLHLLTFSPEVRSWVT